MNRLEEFWLGVGDYEPFLALETAQQLLLAGRSILDEKMLDRLRVSAMFAREEIG